MFRRCHNQHETFFIRLNESGLVHVTARLVPLLSLFLDRELTLEFIKKLKNEVFIAQKCGNFFSFKSIIFLRKLLSCRNLSEKGLVYVNEKLKSISNENDFKIGISMCSSIEEDLIN